MPTSASAPTALRCLLALALLATAGCASDGGGGDVRVDSAAVDGTVGREGRAAPRFGAMADSLPGDTVDLSLPVPGDWAATYTLLEPGFRIDLPTTVRESRRDTTEAGYRVRLGRFPGCRWGCGVEIDVSRRQAPSYLAGIEAEMRAQAADTVDGKAPGEPERVTVGREPALRRETVCGDCTGVEYVLAQGTTVVRLDVDLDARIPYGERQAILAGLARTFDTFRWDSTAPPAPAP
jgi:hypothetical protein